MTLHDLPKNAVIVAAPPALVQETEQLKIRSGWDQQTQAEKDELLKQKEMEFQQMVDQYNEQRIKFKRCMKKMDSSR